MLLQLLRHHVSKQDEVAEGPYLLVPILLALVLSAESTFCAARPTSSETAASSSSKKTSTKSTVIITGASSGLGLATAKKLADSGRDCQQIICHGFPHVFYLHDCK